MSPEDKQALDTLRSLRTTLSGFSEGVCRARPHMRESESMREVATALAAADLVLALADKREAQRA